jgi:hypothetical protein
LTFSLLRLYDCHTILSGKAIEKAVILFSEMTPDPTWEDEFNDWYDQEHIPLRMAVPGFSSAQRYRIPETQHYAVVYEMDSPTVLSSEAYARVKNHPSERTARMLREVSGFTRYTCQEIGVQGASAMDAAHLYAVFFEVPANREGDFNDWYDQDHTPTLLQCPDWLMVRRFRILSGDPGKWTHLALHYLAGRGALQSPERERARSSEWRAKLAAEQWFRPHYLVFDRFGPRQTAVSRQTIIQEDGNKHGLEGFSTHRNVPDR